MPRGQFLAKRLFGPLQMVDSGFFVPQEKLGRLAQTLPDSPTKVIDVSAPPPNDSGGAGAVSTTMDYARFCQMLLNGGQLDSVRVLSRPSVRLMTADHLAGFAGTYFWVDPQEELVGVLMTQAPRPERVYYRRLFKQLVYQAINDWGAPAHGSPDRPASRQRQGEHRSPGLRLTRP
jgi:CubicO group peptidase (beta-lactamase class C family)